MPKPKAEQFWRPPMDEFWNEDWAWWAKAIDDVPDGQRVALEVAVRALRGESVMGAVGKLRRCPITLRAANRFLAHVHRHHNRLQGWKFSSALMDDLSYVGIVTIGRPVSRRLDDSDTLEITRCAVMPHIRNASSMLLGTACRMVAESGHHRVITYTLHSESSVSLRAAGFKRDAQTVGGEWSSPSRPRREADFPTESKVRWLRELQ